MPSCSSASIAKLLAACVAVVGLAGCGKKEEAKAMRAVMTVELISPRREAWPDTVIASGEMAPWQEAIIGAEVAGLRLEKVLVNVGDKVRKGQLLAQFSEETLRADLAAMDAQVAEAEANLATASADARRADKLETNGALSQQAIQVYRAQARAAQARLDSVRAQRDAQALRLRYARVVAPDAGVISSRAATVGAVSMTGTELFRLLRQSRLEWRAEVPAEALARLRPGVGVTLNTLTGSTVAGIVRQLSPTVDAGTRNGIAYVDVPVGSGLAAGMYVSGSFTLTNRDAWLVPESAVVLRDGNRYLMKVDAKNLVQQIKVTTGRRQGDGIEIVGDVDPAARFIKSGGAFVSAGDLVKVTADERATK